MKNIKSELDRLAEKWRDGIGRWEDVIGAARNPNSPLHSYFDWNAPPPGLRDFLVANAKGNKKKLV